MQEPQAGPQDLPPERRSTGTPGSAREVFVAFARLGVTAFGGPVAHLGYFRDAFVVRRKWLDEAAYADLVALCQVLPGPASSQVGMALGLMRAGWGGLLAAWTAFTLPSALLMVLAAVGVSLLGDAAWQAGLLGGLKAAAVAVVAQAVWGMAHSLWPDRRAASVGLAAAGLALVVPGVWGQLAAIGLGTVAGAAAMSQARLAETPHLPMAVGRRTGVVALALFGVLLAGLPVMAAMSDGLAVSVADSVFRAGALVFGGGHVVLPLLQAEVVPPGWVDRDAFLAGYGVAQVMPGPLFAFAAFLGARAADGTLQMIGLAAVALVAMFLPGLLVLVGALPFWSLLRERHTARAALSGVNAAVVGLLLAALYDPVFTAAVHDARGFTLVLAAALMLLVWKLPPWVAVPATGVLGAASAVMG